MDTSRPKRDNAPMRGYLATVIGALVFHLPAYAWSGRRLGSFLLSMAETNPGQQNGFFWIAAAYASALLFSALAGAVGAVLALRATRSPAAVETGTAVLLVLLIGYGVMIGASEIADSVSGWPAIIAIYALEFVAARWFGLRWHAWAQRRAQSGRTDVA